MKIKTIKKGEICEYKGCGRDATDPVFSRRLDKVIACCDICGDVVVDEECPEYEDVCPNCKCRNPVN